MVSNAAAAFSCVVLHLQEVASQAEGYDAADLRVLVDRALHAAARRQLSRPLPGPLPPSSTPALTSLAAHTLAAAVANGSAVSAADFAKARMGFQPAAAWGVGQLQVSVICLCSWPQPLC